MIKLVVKWLPENVAAMTIFPFIFFMNEEYKNNPETVNHEKIHIKQQLEMFILPFFIWYGIEFLIKRIKNDSLTAYNNISFEKESYANQNNLNYLSTRKRYSWVKYL